MKSKSTANIVLLSIFTAFVLTAIIYLTAGNLASRFDVVNEKFFPFYYPWQTFNPTTMAYVSVWVGYALHNSIAWIVIFIAQKQKPKHTEKFYWFNWVMLGTHIVFYALHWIQTQIWYDGLAISVPEVTSQASVILMLVLILILETPRRGLVAGKKIKFHKRFLKIIRTYHGYIITWALIYTFWYHPMENTLGHLAGFFYMFILLAQSVLLYNRAHLNKYWTFFLEGFVLIHGTIVAISQGNGIWPMFAFGFGALIVLTQIYGLGLKPWARRTISIVFVIGLLAYYGLTDNLVGLNEVIRIPFIEYALVFALYLIFLVGNFIVSKVKPKTEVIA